MRRLLFLLMFITAALGSAKAQTTTPSYLSCTGSGSSRVCSTAGTVTAGGTHFSGINSYAALQAAISTCSGAQCTMEVTGTVTIAGTGTATLTTSNLFLNFKQGGSITCPNATTLTPMTVTVSGPFNGPLQTIFNKNCTMAFGSVSQVPAYYPEWRGAVGDGASDDTVAVNAAMSDAVSMNIPLVPTRMYAVNYFRLDNTHGTNTPTVICASRRAGFIQLAGGTGLGPGIPDTPGFPGSGHPDTHHATVAPLTDTLATPVRMEGCHIIGNSTAIYNNPANPGNANAIDGWYSGHPAATASTIHDRADNLLIENTTGTGFHVDFRSYNSQYSHITIHQSDRYCFDMEAVTDSQFHDFDAAQCRYGNRMSDVSNVQLSDSNFWYGGQAIVVSLTSVATSVAGSAAYSCSYSGTEHLLKTMYVIKGFTTSANNGVFTLNAMAGGICTFNNPSAVAETAAATAKPTDGEGSWLTPNLEIRNGSSTQTGGGVTLTNIHSQDGLNGFLFFGNTTKPLVLNASGLESDSDNLSDQTITGNYCYILEYVANSNIEGTCGDWESENSPSTHFQPVTALNLIGDVTNQPIAGNHITLGVFGTQNTFVPVVGAGFKWSDNQVSINGNAQVSCTIAYTASYNPQPQVCPIFNMTLTGNIAVSGVAGSQMVGIPGQTLSMTFVQDGTGSHTVTWDPSFKLPTGCTVNATPGAVTTFKWLSTDGTNWYPTNGCVPASGVPVSDGHGGWSSAKPLAGSGAGVTTGPTTSTANHAVCYADALGTTTDCGRGLSFSVVWVATSGVNTPAVNNPYYAGVGGQGTTANVANVAPFVPENNGTLTSVTYDVIMGTTLGSASDKLTCSIYDKDTSSDVTGTSTGANVPTNITVSQYPLTGLSGTIIAGHHYVTRCVTPASWTTQPSSIEPGAQAAIR